MSTCAVSPGIPAMRTVAIPLSSPGGTIAASAVFDAYTSRARDSPIRTSGKDEPSIAKPSPWIVTRPPSIAARGCMPVSRGEDMKTVYVRSRKSDHSDFAHLTSEVQVWLGVVELDVPVEIVAPAVGCVAEADGNADGRRRLGALRHPQKMHAGFCRRAPTFLAIARNATGNDVLPVLSAALGDRHDMIERQLARREAVTAVLAPVIVA